MVPYIVLLRLIELLHLHYIVPRSTQKTQMLGQQVQCWKEAENAL